MSFALDHSNDPRARRVVSGVVAGVVVVVIASIVVVDDGVR
jgi:hypothetical protein